MILIAGSQGLIGNALMRALWPKVRGYDLPDKVPPDNAEYDSFIDCARYSDIKDQIRTWENVIDHLKPTGGKMILMSSIYGHKAPRFDIYDGTEITPTQLEYAFMKGGVEQAARYLAQKYKHFGIQVNAIAPGGVLDTQSDEFQGNYLSAGGVSMIKLKNLVPVVEMLLDPDNAVNGEVITVDNGWCL